MKKKRIKEIKTFQQYLDNKSDAKLFIGSILIDGRFVRSDCGKYYTLEHNGIIHKYVLKENNNILFILGKDDKPSWPSIFKNT